MVKQTFKEIKRKHLAAFRFGIKKGYLTKELRLEQQDNYEKLAKARGMILNQAIELEEILDSFLTYFFASDARASQFSIIFSKISPSEINAITRAITKNKTKDKPTFLENYFAHDKKGIEFRDCFLPNISLKHKAQIFIETKYFLSNKFSNKYLGLDTLLTKLIDIRNIAAHGIMVHYTKPLVRNLKRTKRKQQIVKLDNAFVTRYFKEITVCVDSISILTDDIWNESFRLKISKVI